MHELVVIGPRCGTGKTSLVACFAQLAGDAVIADCDVDAPRLRHLLKPVIQRTSRFSSGRLAVIWQNRCIACGDCHDRCEYDAVRMDGRESGDATFTIDPAACEGCGVCVEFCPVDAIDFPERESGEWYVSTTPYGPMVHARLELAAENAGRLVSLVRQEARRLAVDSRHARLLVDGSPGLGCPALASVTGADRVLVVAEPGAFDVRNLGHALDLAAGAGVPAAICINRWDMYPDRSTRLAALAETRGIPCLAYIPCDDAADDAWRQGRTPIDLNGASTATAAIRDLWEKL